MLTVTNTNVASNGNSQNNSGFKPNQDIDPVILKKCGAVIYRPVEWFGTTTDCVDGIVDENITVEIKTNGCFEWVIQTYTATDCDETIILESITFRSKIDDVYVDPVDADPQTSSRTFKIPIKFTDNDGQIYTGDFGDPSIGPLTQFFTGPFIQLECGEDFPTYTIDQFELYCFAGPTFDIIPSYIPQNIIDIVTKDSNGDLYTNGSPCDLFDKYPPLNNEPPFTIANFLVENECEDEYYLRFLINTRCEGILEYSLKYKRPKCQNNIITWDDANCSNSYDVTIYNNSNNTQEVINTQETSVNFINNVCDPDEYSFKIRNNCDETFVESSIIDIEDNPSCTPQDCVYKIGIYHPDTNIENEVKAEIENNSGTTTVTWLERFTRTCNGNTEIIEEEVKSEIINTFVGAGLSFYLADGYIGIAPIGDLTVFSTLNPTIPITLNLDSIIFNGNRNQYLSDVKIELQNQLNSLGYSSNFVIGGYIVGDSFTLIFQSINNPASEWIGFDYTLSTYVNNLYNETNSLNIDTSSSFIDVNTSQFTLCGYIWIEDRITVRYTNLNYDNIDFTVDISPNQITTRETQSCELCF